MIVSGAHRARSIVAGLAAWLMLAGSASGCGGASRGGARAGGSIEPPPVAAPGPADALAELRRQAEGSPSAPYWRFRIAEALAASDSAGAERELEEALRRDPVYPPALALRSRLWFRSGRHHQAVAMLEEARSRSAEGAFPAELLAGLALHYEALGRTEEARQAWAALPGPARAGLRSAAVYLALRGPAPDSAASAAAAAVEEEPMSAVHQNNFGITRLRAGDPESARRAFLRAIELDPSLAGPYYNLAILEKFYRFDDAAAARWFEQYRRRSAADPDGLAGLFTPAEPKVAEKKEEP